MTNQVIPAEAVEAAAQALRDAFDWGVDGFDEQAKRALEAAAPYMLAEAWEEAIEAYEAWTWDDENMDPLANPYMLNNEGEK